LSIFIAVRKANDAHSAACLPCTMLGSGLAGRQGSQDQQGILEFAMNSLSFDDIKLFLVKSGLAFDQNLFSRFPLQLLHPCSLLFIKEVGDLRIDLNHDAMASQFGRSSFDLAEDIIADGGL
jgi:hypothetical protein